MTREEAWTRLIELRAKINEGIYRGDQGQTLRESLPELRTITKMFLAAGLANQLFDASSHALKEYERTGVIPPMPDYLKE